MEKRGKKVFNLLSAVLEYPTTGTADILDQSIDMLDVLNWEAKLHLARFRNFFLTMPLGRVMDIYEKTFAPDAACCPFVGHHLLGDERNRSLFAEKVKEDFLSHVGARGNKRPDHIAVILRSLIVQDSVDEARDLIACCLVPAVGKMIDLLNGSENPYEDVLQAILLMLQSEEQFAGLRRQQYAGVR